MVKLQENDATLVHQMLVFLYSCGYYDAHPTQHRYEFDARMYALADKYGIEDLKDIAKYSLSLLLSYPGNCSSSKALMFVKGLGVVYTTTLSSDRGLRDLVIPAFKHCRVALRNNGDFMEILAQDWTMVDL